jgi:hypothetical protein
LGNFNPLNDGDLESIAFSNSGLDSIGLRIAALYPTSVTLVTGFSINTVAWDWLIRQTAPAVVDFVASVYRPGDRVFLVGHSAGGGIVQDAAEGLRKLKIPVAMTGQVDSIGVDSKVSSNVARAFNYYYPGDATCIDGESAITATKSTTIVSNDAISDPIGPNDLSDFCGGHKNMDNDPRVWVPLMNYILQHSP